MMLKMLRLSSGSDSEQIRILFAFIGLATGILAYCYFEYLQSFDETKDFWIFDTIPLFFLACVANFFFMSYDRAIDKASIAISTILASTLSLCLWAKGHHFLSYSGDISDDYYSGAFFTLMPIFWVISQIALPLMLSAIAQGMKHPSYEILHRKAWNLPLLSLSAFFLVGIMWLVLWLWAFMFGMFGVDIFLTTFSEPWFFIPVTSAIYGLGVAIAREKENTIAQLRDLMINLARMVLPVIGVLLIALTPLFLILVLGISTSDTDDQVRGVYACLILLLCGIFAVNAAIGYDHATETQSRVLTLSAKATIIGMMGMILLPYNYLVTALLDFGFSPPRLMGLIVTILLSVYTITYTVILIVHRGKKGEWMHAIRRHNIWIARIIVLTALWLCSPWGNMDKIAAEQQVNRLISGQVSVADFDFKSLYHDFGVDGRIALESLLTKDGLPWHKIITVIIEKIEEANRYQNGDSNSKAGQPLNITVWPKGTQLPDDLVRSQREFNLCHDPNRACTVIAADLTDGLPKMMEYVIFTGEAYSSMTLFEAYMPSHGGEREWNSRYLYGPSTLTFESFTDKAKDFRVETRTYRVLVIGDDVIDPKR